MSALHLLYLGILAMRNLVVLIAVLLCPGLLLAGVPSDDPPPGSDPAASAVAHGGNANAGAISTSGAIASGGAGGDGGHAVAGATGGAGGQATAEQNQAAVADASNDGNSQSVNIAHRRNAPSLAQGSLMPSGCGAGVNGGGSREGGAGFLGLAWTTDQCYALLAAASFAAIGMPDTSCDLLVSMRSVQKAFKRAGKALPDCTSAENRDSTSAAAELGHGFAAIERASRQPPKCEKCVTPEQLDRAFRKSLEK